MSLIPAKHYYGEDISDQWQRKKQTKEERTEAKRVKLHPESHKSAKDVMDENERKRKRELNGEDTLDSDIGELERPLEGLKATSKKAKKLKLSGIEIAEDKQPKPSRAGDGDNVDDAGKMARAEKRKEKEQRKKEKLEKQKRKALAKKSLKEEAVIGNTTEAKKKDLGAQAIDDDNEDGGIERIDISGIIEDSKLGSQPTATPSPAPESPASIISAIPSASSSSSIVPPSTTEEPEKSDKPARRKRDPALPKIDQEALKVRLQARIEELRAARNADGLNGKPARNRQELMEARRRKEEQRKTAKKEMRKQAKEDEEKAKAEAELARLRGSGSPLGTPSIFSPRQEEPEHNFSFGRVAFEDGKQLDSKLTGFLESRKRKGPQDPRTALEAAKKKRARISCLDEEKQADIAEKDLWLNAKKRAHGEKVRDDTSLLKKTLKRKDKAKQKSETEWNARIAGVEKSQEMRQKKREDNLRKRREEKGSKKGKGKAKAKKPGKKAKRPGFEGSFRSKAT